MGIDACLEVAKMAHSLESIFPSEHSSHLRNHQLANRTLDKPPQITTEPVSRKSQEQAIHDLISEDLPPELLRQSLINSITDFEKSFRNNFPIVWFSTLLGPILGTIALLVGLGVFYDWDVPRKLVLAALATFFLFGRFVILIGQDSSALGETPSWFSDLGLSPEQLFAMVTYMDVLTALFVAFHMGFLFRIPMAGPKIAGLASDGKFIMEQQPWLKRLAFFALIAFVIFPTSTTGSIGGSIFGRLLGLGRFRTVLGVMLGSVIGNGLMYFFAKEINEWLGPDSLWLKLSGVLLLVAGVMFIEWRYRKAKNKYLAEQELRHSQPKHSSEAS